MIFFFFYFFFQFNSKNFLRGLKFRWGVFKGARGGGFGVGRFKRGADLEHNQMILLEPLMELKFNDPEIVMMSLLAGDRKWKKQKGGKKKALRTLLKKVLVFNFALHSLRQHSAKLCLEFPSLLGTLLYYYIHCITQYYA